MKESSAEGVNASALLEGGMARLPTGAGVPGGKRDL